VKPLRENSLYRVLSLNSASVGVNMVLGVFSAKIISVFLGTNGMALMGSFRNFSAMAKSLATLGINNSIIRLFVENRDDKKALSSIYATFFWIFLFISLGLGVLVFGFSMVISELLFATAAYHFPIRLFALVLPLTVLNTFWMAIYNGLEVFRKIVVIQIISNIAVFGITALFIWYGNLNGGLVSVAVCELAMVLVTCLFVRSDSEYFRFSLQQFISREYLPVIRNFSVMALLSAVLAPLTLIVIRNIIIDNASVSSAGIWDGAVRLSGFYMVFLNSGLSLYYMPKLASLETDSEFVTELKGYFRTIIPFFAVLLLVIFLFRGFIIDTAFTKEFYPVKDILAWQLGGDMFRIMTLAFGYQIVVKTMMREYFIIEIVFNLLYLALSFYLVKMLSAEGAVQAYFYANAVSFFIVLVMFRKLFRKQS
jgi:O-antigen/teichoic acid export membrane protein